MKEGCQLFPNMIFTVNGYLLIKEKFKQDALHKNFLINSNIIKDQH